MSDKDLRRTSHKVRGNPGWWWYEAPCGICVVHGDCQSVVDISWQLLRSALGRKGKPAQKFARKTKKTSR